MDGILILPVVGCQFRKESCDAMTVDTECEGKLTLVPEPENVHDANAVAVFYCDKHVGYVAATDTELAHWVIDQRQPYKLKIANAKFEKDSLKWFELRVEFI